MKYEVVFYGKDGAAIARMKCDTIEEAIDTAGPDCCGLLVHDIETGKLIISI